MAEDTPEQTTVARIHASDADAGENGHVTYRWADHTGSTYGSMFGIDAETGDVFLKSRLDYEQEQIYKVTRRIHIVHRFIGHHALQVSDKDMTV